MTKKFMQFIGSIVLIFICFQSVSARQNEAVTVPAPVSPSGTITDTTPDFSWKRVAGASQYQFQLFKSGKSVYIVTLLAGDCGAATWFSANEIRPKQWFGR